MSRWSVCSKATKGNCFVFVEPKSLKKFRAFSCCRFTTSQCASFRSSCDSDIQRSSIEFVVLCFFSVFCLALQLANFCKLFRHSRQKGESHSGRFARSVCFTNVAWGGLTFMHCLLIHDFSIFLTDISPIDVYWLSWFAWRSHTSDCSGRPHSQWIQWILGGNCSWKWHTRRSRSISSSNLRDKVLWKLNAIKCNDVLVVLLWTVEVLFGLLVMLVMLVLRLILPCFHDTNRQIIDELRMLEPEPEPEDEYEEILEA